MQGNPQNPINVGYPSLNPPNLQVPPAAQNYPQRVPIAYNNPPANNPVAVPYQQQIGVINIEAELTYKSARRWGRIIFVVSLIICVISLYSFMILATWYSFIFLKCSVDMRNQS